MISAPNHQWQQEQHRLLVEGDPIAPAAISERVYPHLRLHLDQKFPGVDEDLIISAVNDALISYLKHPQQYDPTKKSLVNYLKMAASRDLLNALDSKKRRRKREVPFELIQLGSDHDDIDVEVIERSSELYNKRELIGQYLTASQETELIEKEQAAMLTNIFTDKTDQQLARMVINQVRETVHYAQVLGIISLPTTEQRALVKKHKDRIKKRLERVKEKL